MSRSLGEGRDVYTSIKVANESMISTLAGLVTIPVSMALLVGVENRVGGANVSAQSTLNFLHINFEKKTA